MKKILLSVAMFSIALASVDAHALVRALDLNCQPEADAGVGASFSVHCGIIQSFGPTTINCQADEAGTTGRESIELTKTNKANTFIGEDLADNTLKFKLALASSSGTLTDGKAKFNCK